VFVTRESGSMDLCLLRVHRPESPRTYWHSAIAKHAPTTSHDLWSPRRRQQYGCEDLVAIPPIVSSPPSNFVKAPPCS
jgi:hypothetical protein